MHHDHRTRARAHGAGQRREINLPAMIVEQRIGCQLHILQVGEKLEQGIARLGNKHFIIGIA